MFNLFLQSYFLVVNLTHIFNFELFLGKNNKFSFFLLSFLITLDTDLKALALLDQIMSLLLKPFTINTLHSTRTIFASVW